MEKELENIISHFVIKGTVCQIKAFGNGLINDTLLIKTAEDEKDNYILQKINHHIFTNVEMLQDNIIAATCHIRKKLEAANESDINRKVLTFIPTREGKYYYFDGENYWRVMVFIHGSKSYEAVTPELSYYTGKAIGNFQAMLSDIPVELGETIPNFHNMEFRLKQFHDAVKENPKDRVKEVKYYIDEIEKEQSICARQKSFTERENFLNVYATATQK
jgi:hypothetical protein